jgi:hypothetical protein
MMLLAQVIFKQDSIDAIPNEKARLYIRLFLLGVVVCLWWAIYFFYRYFND